jgi:hypothetical protein
MREDAESCARRRHTKRPKRLTTITWRGAWEEREHQRAYDRFMIANGGQTSRIDAWEVSV